MTETVQSELLKLSIFSFPYRRKPEILNWVIVWMSVNCYI